MYQVDDEDDDDFDYSTSLEFEKALNSPTISPTTSCKDDWTFRFEIDSGKKRGCFWLKKNNAVERQEKWCSLKHIMTGCKSTCGFCDCKESEFFFFEKKWEIRLLASGFERKKSGEKDIATKVDIVTTIQLLCPALQ